MREWLFRLLEPCICTYVTKRIGEFHDAMVRREQIPPIKPGSQPPSFTLQP